MGQIGLKVKMGQTTQEYVAKGTGKSGKGPKWTNIDKNHNRNNWDRNGTNPPNLTHEVKIIQAENF